MILIMRGELNIYIYYVLHYWLKLRSVRNVVRVHIEISYYIYYRSSAYGIQIIIHECDIVNPLVRPE